MRAFMGADAASSGPRKEPFTALFRAEYGYVWGTLRRLNEAASRRWGPSASVIS